MADWSAPAYGVELYSHEGQTAFPLDFDAWENENIATAPGMRIVGQLHARMLEVKFNTKMNLGCPPPLPVDERSASMEF